VSRALRARGFFPKPPTAGRFPSPNPSPGIESVSARARSDLRKRRLPAPLPGLVLASLSVPGGTLPGMTNPEKRITTDLAVIAAALGRATITTDPAVFAQNVAAAAARARDAAH